MVANGTVTEPVTPGANHTDVPTALIRDKGNFPADFCRKMAAGFTAEVYRKRTGVSGLGKSAVKDERMSALVRLLDFAVKF